MKIKISLTRKFLILSAIAFFLLGGLLNYISSIQVQKYTVKKAENDIVYHVKDHAKDTIPKEVFTKSDYLKNKPIFENFSKAIDYLEFKKLKIFDSSGVIIYSSDASLVGQHFENKELKEALEGKVEIEIPKEKKEELSEKEAKKIMEVYIPITYDTASPSGVVEVYFDISELDSEIFQFQKINLLAIAGSLTFLYIILFWIFKNASDMILERNRSLSEVSKALKMGQEQDEAILESMGEGMIVVNTDGQILVYNPKVEAITGYSSQDVLFRHYRHFIDIRNKEGQKLKEDFIKIALSKGLIIRKTHREDIYVKNKDGKLVPISLTIAPIFTKEAKIRGLVFTLHDARTEKELDKVKDEFVYVVAHELGNPIFTIDGYLSLIADETFGKVNNKVKETVQSVRSINSQLSNLVTDLLEVIRSESGQMQIELENTDIRPIIEEAVKNMENKAKSKKITIKYQSIKLPLLSAHKDKLKEVIVNLIDNAIKYSPDKSTVEIGHQLQKDEVITTISDNGYGMTRSEREHLFEKFYRIKNDDTKNIQGTGLGLFIVKTIIEKMKGKIEVESEKGKGTTFSFSLKKASHN